MTTVLGCKNIKYNGRKFIRYKRVEIEKKKKNLNTTDKVTKNKNDEIKK